MSNTFTEYFCGSGAVRLALGAGWECVFANDNDAVKMRSYVSNFGSQGAITRDVARLTTADLRYGTDLSAVDLAWASFPCQDISLAGDRAGLDGARSSTFWSFWRLMQSLRAEGRPPRMIVLENVCGLITSHGGKDFDAICDAVRSAGYRYGAMVIDAMLFCLSRERGCSSSRWTTRSASRAPSSPPPPPRPSIRGTWSPLAAGRGPRRSGSGFPFRRRATRLWSI